MRDVSRRNCSSEISHSSQLTAFIARGNVWKML